eukprot:365508-Chlamydomonas_euryale.AAC.7
MGKEGEAVGEGGDQLARADQLPHVAWHTEMLNVHISTAAGPPFSAASTRFFPRMCVVLCRNVF